MIRLTTTLVVCFAATTIGFADEPGTQPTQEFVLPLNMSEGGIDTVSAETPYEESTPVAADEPRSILGDRLFQQAESLAPVSTEADMPPKPMDPIDAAPVAGGMCQYQSYQCCPPLWMARVEALWLTRNRVSPRTLSVDDRTPGGDVIVGDTDKLDFDYRPGVRLTLERYLGGCSSLAFSYFTVGRWTSNAKTPFFPNGGLDPFWGNDMEDIDLRNFDNALRHDYRYKSRLHNAEINFREARGNNAAVLFGVRYINLRESFRFLSFDSPGAPAVAVDPTDIGIYDIDTQNHLIGLQLGGERRWGGGRWQVGARGKAGVFLNFHEQESLIYDANFNNNPAVRTNLRTSNDDVGVSTVVDLGLFTVYQLRHNIALRAGYDVFFVNNVALAPEQLDTPQWNNSRRKLSDNGSVIYHGPSAGLEFTW